MKKKRTIVEVFVGKMLPLNEGTYSRRFCKSPANHKPQTKIYLDPEQQYFMR